VLACSGVVAGLVRRIFAGFAKPCHTDEHLKRDRLHFSTWSDRVLRNSSPFRPRRLCNTSITR
jgi:hypothetical protein